MKSTITCKCKCCFECSKLKDCQIRELACAEPSNKDCAGIANNDCPSFVKNTEKIENDKE